MVRVGKEQGPSHIHRSNEREGGEGDWYGSKGSSIQSREDQKKKWEEERKGAIKEAY